MVTFARTERLVLTTDETYMLRCLALARLGKGNVSPNPMVGALLVYKDTVIGEGYHQKYGSAHAEVNCIASVKPAHRDLIPHSTIYVSLEPCAHWGKTPPCADLIIRERIPRVVVGCRDPFEAVNGKGIEKLRAAGVAVTVGVSESECIHLNRRFFTFHTKQRPYIILKWAQTADGKMASANDGRLLISNELTNRLVHRWRSEEAGILVGTQTAQVDNPRLDNRLWSGRSPVRLVLDKTLRLPRSLHLFDHSKPTIVFTDQPDKEDSAARYVRLSEQEDVAAAICHACYQLNIQSLLVEGGAQLLQTFIDAGLWDEARIITNQDLYAGGGLASPVLTHPAAVSSERILSDRIDCFYHKP